MTVDERAKALIDWIAGDPTVRSRPDILIDALRDALQLQLLEERQRCAAIARNKYSDPVWDYAYRTAGDGIAASIEAGSTPPGPRRPKKTP